MQSVKMLGLGLGLALAANTAHAQDLWMSPVLSGQTASVMLNNLVTGTGHLVYSTSGPGMTCPPPLAGACFNLANPQYLGATTGTFSQAVPAGLAGLPVAVQAAEVGAGATNVVGTVIGNTAEEIGSGLENFTGSGYWRGNVFDVIGPVRMVGIGMWLNLASDCDLTWEIYEDNVLVYAWTTPRIAGYGYHHGPVMGGYAPPVGSQIKVGVGWPSTCSVTYERDNFSGSAGTVVGGGLSFVSWASSSSWPSTPPGAPSSLDRIYHQTLIFM